MSKSDTRRRITEAYEDALRVYREDRSNYDAGRADGLKQALELIDREYGAEHE